MNLRLARKQYLELSDIRARLFQRPQLKQASGSRTGDPVASFDASWLQAGKEVHPQKYKRKEISFVDLFSGGGGLSLGFSEAIKAFGCRPNAKAAFDTSESSLKYVRTKF